MTTETIGAETKTPIEVLEKLREEHRKLDVQIKDLMATPYLTTDDQLEVARLKKLKLHAKDEIFKLAASLGIEA